MMGAMDRSIAWRAAVLQALFIAVAALALAAALPRSFFESWGSLAGPVAWVACALVVAWALRLPRLHAVGGAALSGVLILPGVLLGAHWLGAPLALAAFGLWCGWMTARRLRVAA